MFCKICSKSCEGRTDYLLHVSVCRKLDDLSQTDEEDNPADDSDADPHWLPSPATSSPVTQEQMDLSEEVEAMLQNSDWLDDNVTIVDYQSPLRESERVEIPDTDTQTISTDMHTISTAMHTISPDTQTISTDMHTISTAMHTISPDMHTISTDMHTISTVPEAITPVRKLRGKWVEITTPRGANISVKWEQVNGSEASSGDEPIEEDGNKNKRCAKRLWNDTKKGPKDQMPTFCPYCGSMQKKNFARHLKVHHSNEEDVQTLITLEKKNASRAAIQKITSSLRKCGRFKYAMKKGSNSEDVIKLDSNEIKVTCNSCLGIYKSNNFRHHWRTCPQRPNTAVLNLLSNPVCEQKTGPSNPTTKLTQISSKKFSTFIPSTNFVTDELLVEAQKKIYKYIQMDNIGKIAIADELIVRYAAEKMPKIDRDKGRLDYLRQGVRDLGRLLLEIKSIDSSISKLEDCFNCSKFDTIVKSVYNLSGTHFLSGTVEKTSYNGRLRTPLGTCCEILMSLERKKLHISEEAEIKLKNLKHFQEELASRWSKVFGSLAERQAKEKGHGKLIDFAHPDDLKLVFKFCMESLPVSVENLKKSPGHKTYESLMNLVALSMFTTSRRRGVDLQNLTVADFKNLNKNRELCAKIGSTMNFTSVEIETVKELACIFSAGKTIQTTAIILTGEMISAMDALLSLRDRYKIKDPRFFIKLSPDPTPWRVESALQWAKKNLPIIDKSNFGVHGIRHLTSTQAQLMTEKEPHVEEIFREGLSHSEKVSKKHYRGNLATRLILGYGAPIMESMGKNTKNTSHTVVSGAHPDISENNFQKEPVSLTEDNFYPTNQPSSSLGRTMLSATFPRETPVCRNTWSSEEDAAIIRRFYNVIKMGCKVTSKSIEAAIREEPSLSCPPARTPVQVRSRLSQIRLQATSTGARLFKIIHSLTSPQAKRYGKK